MLLDHFQLHEEAEAIRVAVEKSIELNISTPDLNSKNHFSTTNVGSFLSDFISLIFEISGKTTRYVQ